MKSPLRLAQPQDAERARAPKQDAPSVASLVIVGGGEGVANTGFVLDPEATLAALMATGLNRRDALASLLESGALRQVADQDAAGANAALNGLLEGLATHEALDLNGQAWVTSLPEGLKVGQLDLRGTQIVSLPESLEVGFALDLRDCPLWDGILPDGVEVEGYVHTDVYPAGVRLNGWRMDHPFGERLDRREPILSGDPESTIIALEAGGMSRWEAMVVVAGAGADLEYFRSKWGLPAEALVPYTSSADAVRAFDRIARRDRDGAIRALFAYLEGQPLSGHLHLGECEWIASLPAGLNLGCGLSLGLFDLPKLGQRASLPEGLTVNGNLYLQGTQIKTLPSELWVDKDLVIASCLSWDGKIPEDAHVGGRVNTDAHCPGVPLAEWRRLHPHGEKG